MGRRRERDRAPVGIERPVDARRKGHDLSGRQRGEERELVASDAGDEVAGLGVLPQRFANALQHCVARDVAVDVVDALELVDVGEDEGELLTGGAASRDLLVKGTRVAEADDEIAACMVAEVVHEQPVPARVHADQPTDEGERHEPDPGCRGERVGRRDARGRFNRDRVQAGRQHPGRSAAHPVGGERDEADRQVEEVADAEARRLQQDERGENPRVRRSRESQDQPPVSCRRRRQGNPSVVASARPRLPRSSGPLRRRPARRQWTPCRACSSSEPDPPSSACWRRRGRVA